LSLVNHGNNPQSGKLLIKISPESFQGTAITASRDVRIDAGNAREVSLDPADVKQLVIRHPHLWWPNGYGRPDLYRLQLQYVNAKGDVYDDTSFVFGIRQVS